MKITGTDKLAKLSARVRDVPKAGQRAMFRAINTTASKVQTLAVRDITSQLALQSSYVRDLFSIVKANSNKLEATVGARVRPMRLARFSARQITRAAKNAKGDASRGIPTGRAAAGVSVKVTKAGGTKRMRKAFLLPLRAGTVAGGNGMGIFVRLPSGELKHLYGPSPDQVFRRWRIDQAPNISVMLAQAYASQLRYELTGSRKA